MTMPGPPPNGMSSTCRWRSCVWSRRSCVWTSTIPRSMPRPTTPCSNTGPNMAGKIVTTSNLIEISYLCVLGLDQPVRDHDAPRLEVHLQHRVPRGRDQVLDRALAAHPDVVGRPLQDLGDRAQVLARAGLHRQPHDLVVVEATVLKRAPGGLRDLQVAAPEQLRHGAVVDAQEFHHQARLARSAPFDVAPAAVEHQRSAGTEPILEVCTGNDLDSSVQPVGAGHLSDTDHEGEPPA